MREINRMTIYGRVKIEIQSLDQVDDPIPGFEWKLELELQKGVRFNFGT